MKEVLEDYKKDKEEIEKKLAAKEQQEKEHTQAKAKFEKTRDQYVKEKLEFFSKCYEGPAEAAAKNLMEMGNSIKNRSVPDKVSYTTKACGLFGWGRKTVAVRSPDTSAA